MLGLAPLLGGAARESNLGAPGGDWMPQEDLQALENHRRLSGITATPVVTSRAELRSRF